MELNLTVQGVSLILTLAANAIIISFSAGRIVSKLGDIDKSIIRLDRELEKRDETLKTHKEEIEKKFSVMWGRIDSLRDLIKT